MSAGAEKKVRNVRILDAAPSKGKIQGRWVQVIRGVIMPEFFDIFEIPDYQRQAMKGKKHEELVAVLAPKGLGVPDDIMLCVPDIVPDFHRVGDGELIIPTSRLVVIDGHQRIDASLARLKQKLATDSLGIKIFLGTSYEEEVATFYQKNRLQTDVSSDVHLRNSGTNAAIEALKELAGTEGFPRIKWDQRETDYNMKAHTLYSVALMLHGYHREGSIEDLLAKLLKSVNRVGTMLFTQNVEMFFRYLREDFATGDLGPFIYRAEFMRGLAKFLADYKLFWDAKQPERLQINVPDRRRLATTPAKAIEQALAVSSAVDAVYNTLLARHKAGKLVQREIDA